MELKDDLGLFGFNVDELLASVEILDGLDIFDLTGENVEAFLKNLIGTLEFKNDKGEVETLDVPEVMFDILLHFYHSFNVMTYTSASGETAYRVVTEGREHDILTTLVSFVLDLAVRNEDVLAAILGSDYAGMISTIIELIGGLDVVYVDMDWAYMYEDDATTTDVNEALKQLETIAGKQSFVDKYSNVYLETYEKTDWSAETATTVYETLAKIAVELIGSLLDDGQDSIKDLVNDLLLGEVYTEKNLKTIVELLVNLLVDFSDYLSIVDVVLGTSATDWIEFCAVRDEEGNIVYFDENGNAAESGEMKVQYSDNGDDVVCTYTWGVDTAADKEAKFLEGIADILKPADALLAWLFFGESITLFNSHVQKTDADGNLVFENGKPVYEELITLNGGRGYAEALVPLLEALLGCVEADAEGNLVSTLPTEAECYDDSADMYRTSTALVGIFRSVLGFVDQVDKQPVEEVFELLPNLFYFISANGLSVVINNLLAPVVGLLDNLSVFGLELDLADLLGMEELDLTDLTLGSIISLVSGLAKININLPAEIVTILEEFFFNAKPVSYTSANGETAYRVDTRGTERDTLTTLLCLVLDLLYTNEDLILSFGLSSELYNAIIKILSGINVTYVDVNWGYMYMDELGENATTEEIEAAKNVALHKLLEEGFPMVDETKIPYLQYSTDWTEEAADNVYSILAVVIDMLLPSLFEDGQSNLADFVIGLLSTELYNDAMLNMLIELIVNLIADFADYLKVADVVLGTDVADAEIGWMTYCEPVEVTETDEETGKTTTTTEWKCNYNWGVDAAAEADKKDVFFDGLAKIVDPANELLSWIFFGNSYKFFWGTTSETTTHSALLTLNGGHGYIEALVPLLELIGCQNLPTLEQCWSEEDKAYMVSIALEGIFDSALNLVKSLSDSEKLVEVVFTLLPSLIYFINANGLSVVVNNLLAPVSSLLGALESFGLKVNIADLIGALDITNITLDALLDLVTGATGIKFIDIDEETEEVKFDVVSILKTFFYVCEVEGYQSASGDESVRLNIKNHGGDILTIILNLVLDVALYEGNKDALVKLLGSEDTYDAIVAFLTAAKEGGYQYEDINWGFMYEDTVTDGKVTESALQKLLNNGLPKRTGNNATVFNAYTLYKNNWTEPAAELLANNLTKIVEGLLGESLGSLINELLAGNVYKESIVNDLIELVVNLLGDFKDYLGALGIVGAEGIKEWFTYCEEVVVDAETGETEWVVREDVDWGIDNAVDLNGNGTADDEKQTAFVNAFKQVLKPADRILAWLLLGEDITFFVDSTDSTPLITLAGGQGYKHAIAPLFELLGCVEADEETGELHTALSDTADVDSMIEELLDALVYIINDISADPVGAVLELLPNLIYFLNAGGVETVVNNLIVPVDSLLVALKGFNVDFSVGSLLEGFGLSGLTTRALLEMVVEKLKFNIPDVLVEFFATFYIGEAVAYTSVDGKTSVRLAYNDEEDAGDMLTILLSLVLDIAAATDENGKNINEKLLVDLLGQDIFDAIMAVFAISPEQVKYQPYTWYSTEVGKVLSPIQSSGTTFTAEAAYNKVWTRDMAKYISDNLVDFATDILCLLGLKIGDMRICSLDDLVDGLLGGMLYTQEMADTILNTLKDLISAIADLEYGDAVLGIVASALGVDVRVWNTMQVTVVDGDRTSFINALKKILAPIVPLLDVLLCGESISFFYSYKDLLSDDDIKEMRAECYAACDTAAEAEEMLAEKLEFIYANRGVITIPGSEGYALAIAPIFEALGCIDEETNVTTLLQPETFKALSDEEKMAHIIDVLLARVDKILEDPVNNLFTLLPGLIYFINSNGLDTAVNNLAAGVNVVLGALTPLLGEEDENGNKQPVSLMSLLGVDLKEYNFKYIMDLLMDLLNEYITDNQLQTYIVDFVAELTTGEVVEYLSAGSYALAGEDGKPVPFYTARYANETQLADMITIILRLVVKWLATGNNGAAVIELLGVFAEDEEAAKSGAAFVNFILAALDLEYPASSMMAAVYWIFYALDTVAEPAHDGYHDLNSTWSAVYDFIEVEAGPTTKNLLNVIKKYFSVDLDLDGVIDEDGVASDGALTFFEKIAAFFQKILDFFKNLFGG